MLSSSSEYLEALRRGNYLLFLEWPNFIASQSDKNGTLLGVDEAIPLLIFDWLNNDFCEDDVKKIALLHAMDQMKSGAFRGNLAYALMIISSVMLECMVYRCNNLHGRFVSKEKMTTSEIITFMRTKIASIDDDEGDDFFIINLEKQQSQFLTWVNSADRLKAQEAYSQISYILDSRYILSDYITKLDKMGTTTTINKLTNSRSSMVKRLAVYLNDQTEFSLRVKEQIYRYVSIIRDMQPTEWEEVYLEKISPLPPLDKMWKSVKTIGIGFFNVMQNSALKNNLDDKENNSKNEKFLE